MKRSLWSLVWIRRALGVTVMFGVVVMVILNSEKPFVLTATTAVADERAMPELGGAVGWINSSPMCDLPKPTSAMLVRKVSHRPEDWLKTQQGFTAFLPDLL
jgi:hypothetical protein